MKNLFLALVLTTFLGTTTYSQVQFGGVQKLATVPATGNITTQNLVPAGTATANSAVEITLNGASNLSIQTTGTYTGALSIQVTINGSTWVTLGGVPILNTNTGGYLSTITSALQSTFQTEVGGFLKARVTGLAAMTGTATVTMIATQVPSLIALDNSIPTGANVIGAVTQSGTWTAQIGNTANTTPILANNLIPAATTTGDTGAKTATFNGSTQTNTTAKGIQFVFNVGAVTGTTPTMVCKIQGSSDGGTNWVDLPNAVTATLVATGVYGLQLYPGITTVAPVATTGTMGSINTALPRTWRVVYTIGGATPSFTLTNVQFSYLL